MNRDQLEAFALRLKAEMDREREERNYFQLERDKIRTFWEITRQQLGESATQATVSLPPYQWLPPSPLTGHRGFEIWAAAEG